MSKSKMEAPERRSNMSRAMNILRFTNQPTRCIDVQRRYEAPGSKTNDLLLRTQEAA